jgi:hypothetical protein
LSGEPLEVVQEHFQKAWEAMRRARDELGAAQVKVERAEGRVDALRQLMLELREHRPSPKPPQDGRKPDPALAPQDKINWLGMPRSKAILTMMRTTGKPMGPADLSRALKDVGRTKDEPNYVSSTLDFLKKRGKVRSLGEGQWVPVDQEGPGEAKAGGLFKEVRG